MNESDLPTTDTPLLINNTSDTTPTLAEVVAQTTSLVPPVDPVRSAAGRLGGRRVHELAALGRVYEQEHGMKAGRQRLKQLVQLGRKYEAEHGLQVAKPRRKRKGDAWQEFLLAFARVIKGEHRPDVEQLIAALRPGPKGIATVTNQAA
ncbi:MAG: hypothetical protein JWO38_5804 [Gemmataceae bacterium]|nr:hypothetical protein [Gemmataceae bacterium]